MFRPELGPLCEPLMQLGPNCLWDSPVSGISDEDVREPVGVLLSEAGQIGPDQLLAHQRLEVATDLWSHLLRGERRHGGPPEYASDDRGSLDHGSLIRVQPIKAGGHEGMGGRR